MGFEGYKSTFRAMHVALKPGRGLALCRNYRRQQGKLV
jgi:hypothetical protein